MPSRLCLAPGCGSEATYRGRCAAHARGREQEINRAGKDIYRTKRWRLVRRRKLHDFPICERCQLVLATEVHHVQDIADGGDPYSPTNLASLCASCHSKEGRMRQMARTK